MDAVAPVLDQWKASRSSRDVFQERRTPPSSPGFLRKKEPPQRCGSSKLLQKLHAKQNFASRCKIIILQHVPALYACPVLTPFPRRSAAGADPGHSPGDVPHRVIPLAKAGSFCRRRPGHSADEGRVILPTRTGSFCRRGPGHSTGKDPLLRHRGYGCPPEARDRFSRHRLYSIKLPRDPQPPVF